MRIKLVEARSTNDCGICAVAMVAGLTWDEVYDAAEECGFILGSDEGSNIGEISMKLNLDFEWIESFNDIGPSIISIDSLTPSFTRHAVVYNKGRIFDCSPGEKASLDHVKKTAHYTYFAWGRSIT